MTCSKCSAENAAGAKFCIECGESFKGRCPKCGLANPANAKFCQECGTSFGSAAEPKKSLSDDTTGIRVSAGQPGGEIPEGERKTVTALFADIKGSTEMMEDLDPEEARAIVDPALKLMIDAVRRYDGYIVQSTGDGIFALFGAPIAHEDHPQRALYAALRMHDENRRYSDKLRAEGRSPLQIRIGADTGEVVVRTIETGGKTEYTPIGHAANLASRMQSLANPGSTLISESTRKLVEGYFALKSLGSSRVKGIAEPVSVYEVTGLGPLRTRLQRSAGRGYTKFVGRQREMEALRHASEQAKAGHGQIVAAVAEPGVGKSRLFYEFKVKNQSDWMVLEAFSVSHGKASAFLPVLDLLDGYFRITSDDDARTRREKVAGRVAMLDRTLEDTLPYLLGLLGLSEADDPLTGMEPQLRTRRTLDAIKRIFVRESLNQPLMLMFEDLHWIDNETQTLLNLLADSIATAKILLLVNYRPEYSHSWGSKTYYTQLRLDPLGRESADEMLASLIGGGEDLAALKRLIIDETEGNPFFMEEIYQSLIEEGALVRNGAVKLTRPLDTLRIPATVQGILASRIDRLPAAEKELLQTLAVIGKEFPLALVRAVAESHRVSDLDRMLQHLQLAEFIYEQPAVGDIEYTFKHALTQEVAYNSLLHERRRALHERIGGAVEALYADTLNDHVDQLAHHYRRSANIPKAIDYLSRAAEQAVVRNAFSEAVADYRDALALLGGIADAAERERREAALQVALGGTLSMQSPAAAGIEEVYLRARELCGRIGDAEGLFTTLFGLRLYYSFRAEMGRALELCDEMLKIAGDADLGRQLSAHVSTAQTLYFAGELGASRRHLELAREKAAGPTDLRPSHQIRQRMLIAEPRSRHAMILSLLGYPDRAAQEGRQALAFARGQPVPLTVGLGEYFTAQLYFLLREVRKVREHSEAAGRIGNQYGNAQLAGHAEAFVGWADAAQGDAAGGIRQIRRAMERVELVGARIRTMGDVLLIECLLRHGAIGEGLAAASGALAHAQTTGERYCEAELERLRGELLIVQDNHESAQDAFRSAIEIARSQSAKWWELRATTSLARLLRDTNRRDEARAMLSEIYNWFTEGFDTADLKDAKALLEQLHG